MATEVRDVITDALRELGVLAAGETLSADDGVFGLAALNRLVDQWAAERLAVYTVTRTTWTIVSGTQTYAVGSGSAVNVARPVFLDHVGYINTGLTVPQEFQLTPLTDDAWSNVPIKDLTSPFPTSYYYNPTYPTGTLTLWPKPTSSTLTGVLYAPQAVPEFAGLDTAVVLPPGYRRMLVKNLALDLAPSYTKSAPPELVVAAQDSVAAVKRSNKRLMDMSVDAGALGQGTNKRYYYNIVTGP